MRAYVLSFYSQKTDPLSEVELLEGLLKQKRAVLANFDGKTFDEERWRVEERQYTMNTCRQKSSVQTPKTLPMVAVHNRNVVGTNQVLKPNSKGWGINLTVLPFQLSSISRVDSKNASVSGPVYHISLRTAMSHCRNP